MRLHSRQNLPLSAMAWKPDSVSRAHSWASARHSQGAQSSAWLTWQLHACRLQGQEKGQAASSPPGTVAAAVSHSGSSWGVALTTILTTKLPVYGLHLSAQASCQFCYMSFLMKFAGFIFMQAKILAGIS